MYIYIYIYIDIERERYMCIYIYREREICPYVANIIWSLLLWLCLSLSWLVARLQETTGGRNPASGSSRSSERDLIDLIDSINIYNTFNIFNRLSLGATQKDPSPRSQINDRFDRFIRCKLLRMSSVVCVFLAIEPVLLLQAAPPYYMILYTYLYNVM